MLNSLMVYKAQRTQTIVAIETEQQLWKKGILVFKGCRSKALDNRAHPEQWTEVTYSNESFEGRKTSFSTITTICILESPDVTARALESKHVKVENVVLGRWTKTAVFSALSTCFILTRNTVLQSFIFSWRYVTYFLLFLAFFSILKTSRFHICCTP